MNVEIVNFILDELKENGPLTTSQIQKKMEQSNTGNHRFSVLRNSYLVPMAENGQIRLIKEQDQGGGLWTAS